MNTAPNASTITARIALVRAAQTLLDACAERPGLFDGVVDSVKDLLVAAGGDPDVADTLIEMCDDSLFSLTLEGLIAEGPEEFRF